MATRFLSQHLETISTPQKQRTHLAVVVTAEDMRREHEEALRVGHGHPGYEHAKYLLQSVHNALENFGGESVDSLLQITFQARAEARNKNLLPT